MKISLLFFCFLFLTRASAQHALQKIWETDTVIAVPESVLPDTKKGILYVSLIDGPADAKDGRGGVAILNRDGKVINAAWVVGLNAPKGMGIYKNRMYVADLEDVVEIDVKSGKVLQRIHVPDAKFLNDITIDKKGVVYVSDTRTNNVYQIKDRQVSTYLTGLTGANGLRVINSDLYILTSKELLKAGENKALVKIADLDYPGDGIEPVGNGDFIVSAWAGYIHYITADGKKQLLLNTTEQKKNTADIGFDPKRRIIYVPTFLAKSVMAYQLQ
ncbi:MAG: ATP-binding protein [Flavisolibacter sp.]|nr:ATP-binding protein [Flavisolibacter sp.]MBD0350921.1 ATP-binding protein [Flavisolibacter sp.]